MSVYRDDPPSDIESEEIQNTSPHGVVADVADRRMVRGRFKKYCIRISVFLLIISVTVTIISICVAVTLDKLRQLMLVAHMRDPTRVSITEPRILTHPKWPPKRCPLPEGAAWALAKPDVGDPFNIAVFSPQDPETTSSDGYDVSIQLSERGYFEMNGPSRFPGLSSSSRRTDGTHDPGVILDLGANVGDWTFFMANAGWRVIAVEASPHAFALLNATLCANEERFGPYVRIVHAAITDRPGDRCEVCYSRASSEVLCESNTRTDRHHCSDVETQTIRDVLQRANVANVDAFHMDIEGMECAALRSYPEFAQRNTLQWNWIATHKDGVRACVQQWADAAEMSIWKPWGQDAIITRENKWLNY